MFMVRTVTLGLLQFFAPRNIVRGMHYKCRNTEKPYLRSNVYRAKVPDALVEWEQSWPDYSPTEYTSPFLVGKPYADPDISATQKFCWNELDGKIDRRSYIMRYEIGADGRPLNPKGRTGLKGRGVLGRWGPNHAADPIVSRLRDDQLQFIGIQRSDTGEWAVPGGMVDPGELVSQTLRREFGEEALGSSKSQSIDELFKTGVELYRGYVDDPRNTDNAWMETVAVNYHDTNGVTEGVCFRAGDDAVNIRWIPVSRQEKLYASHEYLIELLAKLHNYEF
ncbi:hypothetical protein AB6A40_006251 [Gnathostoma spinigerum]|uniref:Nudix hydrolase domain-containing protein n=1 Tax=Gnathostoma spinigerum TaxID=75299 RepID=A0ABD6EK14_9BILA